MKNPLVKWGSIAFVAWWIIHDPGSFGLMVQRLGHLATQAASSLATALTNL